MQTDHLPPDWKYEKRGRSYAVWDENGVPRCGAKCRNGARKGKPCLGHPEKGRLRCNIHQGDKSVGPERGSWKTGEHSRYFRNIPPRLQGRYLEMLESGDLGNLAENIALLDVMLAEQLNRLDIGQFGASYNALRSLHLRANRQWETAIRGTDADQRREALQTFTELFNEMGELISTGQRDYVTLQNILSINSERRQTVKTMSDIEMKGENAVPVSQLMVIIASLDNLFKRVNRLEGEDERAREFAIGIQSLVSGD